MILIQGLKDKQNVECIKFNAGLKTFCAGENNPGQWLNDILLHEFVKLTDSGGLF
jgi:hypothetical protein